MPIDSSKFFDSIRIKPTKTAGAKRPVREEAITCEWAGCENRGSHRAPKGRGQEKEYFHFCLNHVREYNQSYNFFQGMNADAVARYQKDALTGHRPTWKMGANGAKGKGKAGEVDLDTANDPFHVFSELNGRGKWRPGLGGAAEVTRPRDGVEIAQLLQRQHDLSQLIIRFSYQELFLIRLDLIGNAT